MEGIADGELRFSGNATYVTKFDIDQDETGNPFDGAGNRNRFIGFGSIPELRANLSANWQNDVHSVGVTVRYISDYRDETPMDTPENRAHDIDAQTVVDFQYGINLDDMFDGGTKISLGINNLFDEEPPAVETRIAYDGQVHDPRGRVIYVRAKYSF